MEESPAFQEHFFHHSWKTQPPPPSVINGCHWCQLRVLSSQGRPPLTLVNKTGDGAELPPGFRFITESVLAPGVPMAEANFRSGCSCATAEACKYDGCECLSDMDWDSEGQGWTGGHEGSSKGQGWTDGHEGSSEEDELAGPGTGAGAGAVSRRAPGGRRRIKFAYYSSGRRAGLIRRRYLFSREPIYECHEGCRCSHAGAGAGTGAASSPSSCPNRVVERGRRVPLQIFRTAERGWGVRTLVDLEQGRFVDCYVGEILTAPEADRRRADSTRTRRKDIYLFALDKFSDPGSLDPRLAGAPLEVDGEFLAGPTRFINHSCEPNLRIFARVGDHVDKHIHNLAFFAVRDIAAGDELTFDYTDGRDPNRDSRDGNKDHEGMTRCLCGSAKCRGYLW